MRGAEGRIEAAWMRDFAVLCRVVRRWLGYGFEDLVDEEEEEDVESEKEESELI